MTVIETTPLRYEPLLVAPETYVIQATHGEGKGPLAVHMNAMVIRGREPVVVDTGAPIHREQYLDDLFSIVEPEDVRWVFISHDDVDHYGNLLAVMAACPHATLVGSWYLIERMTSEEFPVPPTRWRWVGDGETFVAGDRELLALRPPLYDSPTTRGLFDPTTGVYWAADCYATPVERGTTFTDELDRGFWEEGFTAFQTWNSPWVSIVDEAAYHASCARVESLGATTIAGTHSPTIRGAAVADAFALTRALPAVPVPPQPGQVVLDEIVRGMTA